MLDASDSAQADAAAGARELPRVGWKIFALHGAAEATWADAMRLCGPAATVVLVGPEAEGALDAAPLVMAEAQLRVSLGAHPDLYAEVAALVLRGDVRLPTPEPVPLAQAAAALEWAASTSRVAIVAVRS